MEHRDLVKLIINRAKIWTFSQCKSLFHHLVTMVSGNEALPPQIQCLTVAISIYKADVKEKDPIFLCQWQSIDRCEHIKGPAFFDFVSACPIE